MILERLTIVNFKNLRDVDLEFSPNINCLIGKNGEGKTNLLSAIYFLSMCNADGELLTHGESVMHLAGYYKNGESRKDSGESRAGSDEISAGLKQGGKKVFKRNGKSYKKLSEHIGLLPIVMVTPYDSQLIEGSSEERRKFMDLVISQYDSLYLSALTNYNRALQQRNALLKQGGESQAADDTLIELLEEQMAEYGEAVYNKRAEFIEAFIPYFQRLYDRISGGKEQVRVEYISHCQRGPLLEVIRRDRAKDRIMGYSLHGIHRDDLQLMLGEWQMRREGSQGQNKSFVLAMKLAEYEFLRNSKRQMAGSLQSTSEGSAPILLLDDIFDKLDAGRVENIISLVASADFGQIFITDTNRENLDKIIRRSTRKYKIFSVENGSCSKI